MDDLFDYAEKQTAAAEREKYDELCRIVRHNNELYYSKAEPEITDAEYDRLYRELEEIGLAAPQVTYILHSLKEKGLDVDVDATTVGEAVETVMQALARFRKTNL